MQAYLPLRLLRAPRLLQSLRRVSAVLVMRDQQLSSVAAAAVHVLAAEAVR